MRRHLLTIILLAGIGVLSTVSTNAIAQSTADAHAKLTSSYAIIPGGNYGFYNTTNGHSSDSRAAAYVTHTDALQIEEAPDGNSGFHLQLTKDATIYAQTGFYFMAGASDKYVVSEDAVEIDGPNPWLFLSSYSSDGVNVCINTMSDYAEGKKIRLYVNAAYTGPYTLSLADFNEIDTANYTLSLIDNQQKDSIDLIHNTYPFNINKGDTTSFGASRFVVSVQHKPVALYVLSSFSGEKVSTGTQLSWTAVNAGNYTGYTLQKLNAGETADSIYFVQSDNGTNTYSFVDMHPIIGNNVYRLKQNGINGAITYSATVTIGYNNSGPGSNLSLYPNPAKSTMNASLTSGSSSNVTYMANIYNSMGGLVKHEEVSANAWTEDVSSYKTGVYFIQVKDNNGNLVAQSKFVKAE